MTAIHRTYRIYSRDPVVAGKWYYTIDCRECGKPIYLFEDKTGGASPATMMGDGKVSSTCLRCTHDEAYFPSEIKVVQAEENIDGQRPPRVETSRSPRQPLSRTCSRARPTLGVGYIEDRPKAAAIVGRIITSWADIEVQSARLLAEMMGTNVPVSAAVFGSLRSSRAQHDALEAAASIALDAKDYELFCAHMARKSSLEKERNDLAHGCFGVTPALPEDIIWVSQTDYLEFTASFEHDPDSQKNFRDKMFVYTLGTLERIAQEIEEFYNQLGFFKGYLWARTGEPNPDKFRSERYPQLCNQPHIREALGRIRTAKKHAKASR